MQKLIHLLSQKTPLKKEHIANILSLLDEGATIPFIARYRKELTGGADDILLREFEMHYNSAKNLLERKEEIIRLLSEREFFTPELGEAIEAAQTLRVLENIYRPFKEQKNSRAAVAIAKGLTPLADLIAKAKISVRDLKARASQEEIEGAQDILAQRYAEDAREREVLHDTLWRFGSLETKGTKTFDPNGVYKNLADKSEKIAHIPSHRYLAIMRGVKEKELSAKITTDVERIESNIKKYKIPSYAGDIREVLFEAYKDGLKRLLLPSLEREIMSELKERADLAAIHVFGKNLTQLLLTPPVSHRVILGVDPAFRTGCKLAVIDENGVFLEGGVIYPTEPRKDYAGAKKTIEKLVTKYKINGVAIGNGTASRETTEFFAKLAEDGVKLDFTVVSEAGASVYSASKLASQEYPDLDVTIRGAISIAQRLRDPMATLVKIDPKSLGIGQYQHDVDQKLLEKKLSDTTVDVVNKVGVDINSASAALLSYVAGLSPKIANNILDHKKKQGNFSSKEELLKVKGLGAKTFEQAAGFIRIKEPRDMLDNTGIHPESYAIARKLQGKDLDTLDLAESAKALDVGTQTLQDIIKELKKPGFDPREELPAVPFKEGLTEISMLSEGSFVSGVVRNITDFGAFVDIGIKNDGMIHISKMGKQRITHPLEVLSLNQFLPQIEVLSIDKEKNKVSLGLPS
ncbi:MAG: helix-hairpin-helix domain-containing protein [Helicobacteraceae bacterium]|nr:helix-hairpin-helix domain-containing protein [Helicobacteraceae bacterium]